MIAHGMHIYKAMTGWAVLDSFEVRDQAVLTEGVATAKAFHTLLGNQ